MMVRSLCLAAALIMSAAAPVGADSGIDSERAALLGDYAAGSYARYLRDARAQSQFYQDAYRIAPDDIRLGRLALYSALFADDRKLTKNTAERLYRKDKDEGLARAILAVDAFSRGRTSRVKKYATEESPDVTMSLAMKIVLGWNAVDERRYDRAREIFGSMGGAAYFEGLGFLQLAKVEALADNEDAAITAFDAAEESGVAPLEYGLARARFDADRGEVELAIDRLEAMLADNPASELGPVGDYLNRLQSGKRLPRLSERAQAARALTDPAFAFFVRSNSVDGAEVFLRFARWVDPDFDRAALWLAGLIEETHPDMDEPTRNEVLQLYKSIGEDSPYFVSARLSEANIYFDEDRDDVGIALLEETERKFPSYYTKDALGRARLFRENWEEALPFYDDLVESLSEEELRANPEPLHLRGIIYERLDRWSEAEADFLQVLEYTPDDADTLNYLGYTWVDRGENLEEAFDMIEKAVELEPASGAITDSLGWAHYKLGRFSEAKRYLEEAVVLTPYSATIIDHLGDAYWQLGRKREATYQWQRALEYDPTDEERDTIEAKLAAGINAIPAQ